MKVKCPWEERGLKIKMVFVEAIENQHISFSMNLRLI